MIRNIQIGRIYRGGQQGRLRVPYDFTPGPSNWSGRTRKVHFVELSSRGTPTFYRDIVKSTNLKSFEKWARREYDADAIQLLLSHT